MALKQLASALDPARPGFVGRMARILAVVAGVGALLAVLGIVWAAGRPTGRYLRAGLLVELQAPERAVGIARALVQEHPRAEPAYHELYAMALRRSGRPREAVAALEAGQEALPESWSLRLQRCSYNGLFGEPQQALPICNRAVDSARTPDERRQARAHRGMVRGLAGDSAGALDDLRAARPWIAEAQPSFRPYGDWLTALERGEDPFDTTVLDEERQR